MARKSNGGKAPRKSNVVNPAPTHLVSTGGAAPVIPPEAAAEIEALAKAAGGVLPPEVRAAFEAGMKAGATAPLQAPSHKPLDYSKFENLKDDDSDDEGQRCWCGERHPTGVHADDEVNGDEDDDEEDESADSADDISDMPGLISDKELENRTAPVHQMTATEYEEAKAAFAAEQAKQAKEAATAAAAAAAIAKPKGIAKGFLTAGAPAKATNGAFKSGSSGPGSASLICCLHCLGCHFFSWLLRGGGAYLSNTPSQPVGKASFIHSVIVYFTLYTLHPELECVFQLGTIWGSGTWANDVRGSRHM